MVAVSTLFISGKLTPPNDVIRRLIEESDYHADALDTAGETHEPLLAPGNQAHSPTDRSRDEYIIRLAVSDEGWHEFTARRQDRVMADVVQYLIDEYDLYEQVAPESAGGAAREWSTPGRYNRVLSDTKSYITEIEGEDQEYEMISAKELTAPNGQTLYLDTHAKKEDKIRRLRDLVRKAGLDPDTDLEFGGLW